MDLAERIARRRSNSTDEDLLADVEKLDPSRHLEEPVGRGSLFERFLDVLEPVFDGDLPSDVVVRGPGGAGKSAVVVALLSELSEELSGVRSGLYTTTRGGPAGDHVRFAYVDARRASSRHKLYYGVLESLTRESVPERGVGTGDLRERIRAELADTPGAVVAVDHLDENGELGGAAGELADEFDDVAWITIGRSDPAPPSQLAAEIEVPPYRTHELVDLLTIRANRALTTGISHEQARRIASWAEGDAHDALACLFTAATAAQDAGHARVRDADIGLAIDRTPRDCAPVGRVLALSENRQAVLAALLDLSEERRGTIERTADAVAADSSLTRATVRRFLYELADQDLLEKVPADEPGPEGGRRPTRLEPRFPATVFRRLRSLRA